MPISSLTQVLLRLSALNWFVTGTVQIAATVYSFRGGPISILQLAAPVILFFMGIIFWAFAPFLSRQFTKNGDGTLSFGGVTLFSLYSTAFVGIGLWFALANVGQVFNGIHFYVFYGSKTIHEMTEYGQGSFYSLSQAVLTFVAGVFLIVTAQTWARKLTERSGPESPGAMSSSGTSGMTSGDNFRSRTETSSDSRDAY